MIEKKRKSTWSHMRYIAETKLNNSKIKRLMIHSSDDGIFMFVYDTLEDGPCFSDNWFQSID